MTALSLLNNFERELTRPFFKNNWLDEAADVKNYTSFSSSMRFDDKKSAWTLTVELAGVTKNNVKIDTLEGYLQLSGEKTKGVHLGKFEARFNLPEGIDSEKIEAVFEDGVLNVEIPMAEKKLTKTIQIR
jgi:HSP20 family protein